MDSYVSMSLLMLVESSINFLLDMPGLYAHKIYVPSPFSLVPYATLTSSSLVLWKMKSPAALVAVSSLSFAVRLVFVSFVCLFM